MTVFGAWDDSQMLRLWLEAKQGDAPAQYALGDCYRYGCGVSQDHEEAVTWYRKAADQGYAPAQKALGDCYGNGHGVHLDRKEAEMWYRKAADQGYGPAQEALGDCYGSGHGVHLERKEAEMWPRKAADQGYGPAQEALGDCYGQGKSVSSNYEEAVMRYRKWAGLDNPTNCHTMWVHDPREGQKVRERILAEASRHRGGDACFVATAAYGSSMAKEVCVLRWFRDEHLAKCKAGRFFMIVYYRASPRIAALIARHPVLRSMMRILLWPIVWTIATFQNAVKRNAK